MADENTRNQNSKSPTFEAPQIKMTSKDKQFFDDFVAYLQLAFTVEVTSPKMYNDEKDVFFQYLTVKRRA